MFFRQIPRCFASTSFLVQGLLMWSFLEFRLAKTTLMKRTPWDNTSWWTLGARCLGRIWRRVLFTYNRFSRIRILHQKSNWSFAPPFFDFLLGFPSASTCRKWHLPPCTHPFSDSIQTHGRMQKFTSRIFTECESAWNVTLIIWVFLFTAWSLWGFLFAAVSVFRPRMGCRRRRSSFSSLTLATVSRGLDVMTETTWVSFGTLSLWLPLKTLSRLEFFPIQVLIKLFRFVIPIAIGLMDDRTSFVQVPRDLQFSQWFWPFVSWKTYPNIWTFWFGNFEQSGSILQFYLCTRILHQLLVLSTTIWLSCNDVHHFCSSHLGNVVLRWVVFNFFFCSAEISCLSRLKLWNTVAWVSLVEFSWTSSFVVFLLSFAQPEYCVSWQLFNCSDMCTCDGP